MLKGCHVRNKWEVSPPHPKDEYGFPLNAEIGDYFIYIDPIGGATHVKYQFCGVAGWAFISRD